MHINSFNDESNSDAFELHSEFLLIRSFDDVVFFSPNFHDCALIKMRRNFFINVAFFPTLLALCFRLCAKRLDVERKKISF